MGKSIKKPFQKRAFRLAALLILVSFMGLIFAVQPTLKLVFRKVLLPQLKASQGLDVTFADLKISILPPKLTVEGVKVASDRPPLNALSLDAVELTPFLGLSPAGRFVFEQIRLVKPDVNLTVAQSDVPQEERMSLKEILASNLSDWIDLDIRNLDIVEPTVHIHIPKIDAHVHMTGGSVAFSQAKAISRLEWRTQAVVQLKDVSTTISGFQLIAWQEHDDIFLEAAYGKIDELFVSLRGEVYPDMQFQALIQGDLKALGKTVTKFRPEFSFLERSVGEFDLKSNIGDGLETDIDLVVRNFILDGHRFGNLNLKADYATARPLTFTGSLSPSRDADMTFKGEINEALQGDINFKGKNILFAWIQNSIDPKLGTVVDGPLDLEGSLVFDGAVGAAQAKVKAKARALFLKMPELLEPHLSPEFENLRLEATAVRNVSDRQWSILGQLAGNGFQGDTAFTLYEHDTFVGGEGDWNIDVSDFGGLVPRQEGYTGQGTIIGSLSALERKSVTAQFAFNFDRFGVSGEASAEHKFKMELRLGQEETEIDDLRIWNDQESLVLNGHFPVQSGHGAVMLQAEAFSLPMIAQIIRFRNPNMPTVEGFADIAMNVDIMEEDVLGKLRFRSTGQSLSIADQTLDALTFDMRLKNTEYRVTDLRADQGKGFMLASGGLREDAFEKLTLRWVDVSLDRFDIPKEVLAYVLSSSGEAELTGSYDNPLIMVSAKAFDRQNRVVDPWEISLEGLAKDCKYSIQQEDMGISSLGSLNLIDGELLHSQGLVRSFSMTPVTGRLDVRLSGSWNFTSKTNGRWTGDANISRVNVSEGAYALKTVKPFNIKARDNRFFINEAMFSDEGGRKVRLEGELGTDGSLAAELDGDLDLRTLLLFELGLRDASGRLSTNIGVTGTLSSPILLGSFSVSDGRFELEAFPSAFEQVEIEGALAQKLVSFSSIAFVLGGGSAKGEGSIVIQEPFMDSELNLLTNFSQVRTRFPEFLPVETQGEIGLKGPIKLPTLFGDITVVDGVYTDEWDWKSSVLRVGSDIRTSTALETGKENILFDLGFRSSQGSLRLQNDLASGRLDTDLRLIGSDRQFELSGKVEVLDGLVEFLDNEFEITAGVVEFIPGEGGRMDFDINAKTVVQETTVFLDIRSDRDEIRAYLSSQPPKEETNLIALLTLGVDSDDLVAASERDSENIPISALLPSVLSAPVQSKLEHGLKQALSIDSVQFVPFFSETTKTTGLKLVVEKKILKKLRLLYSTDLFAVGLENSVQLEQRINSRFSVQGSLRDYNGELNENDLDIGLDLEYRLDF